MHVVLAGHARCPSDRFRSVPFRGRDGADLGFPAALGSWDGDGDEAKRLVPTGDGFCGCGGEAGIGRWFVLGHDITAAARCALSREG